MSKVSREQPWSIISTIGKYPFVRMLQNCHKNSSYLDELRKDLHFASALSEDSSLSDAATCVGAGKDRCVAR